MCICTTAFLSIHLLMISRLLPCPGYYKQFCDEQWGTCVPHPEHPPNFPPHSIPFSFPRALALSALFNASNLDWSSISHIVIYMFQCCSLKSSHPHLLSESKTLFFTSVSLLLSCIKGYCYHLSKFHIYALVYCIGVLFSGLLHSV